MSAASGITGPRDVAYWEVGASFIIALAINMGVFAIATMIAIRPIEVEVKKPEAPEEVPVAVKPVVDMEAVEAARKAGKKVVIPDMWERAPPSVKKKIQETPPKPTTTAAAASTNAGRKPEDIPDASTPVENIEDVGPEPKDATEGEDSGLTASTEDSGPVSSDSDGGSNNAPPGQGCTDGPLCTNDGGNKNFVLAQYQGRLISFFKRGFVVNGLGLAPEDIKKLVVSASVTISDDGTVTGFTLGSSGNPTFDAAARAQLQAKVGQQIPPPPEDYPELKQSALSFSMTCGSGCN
ncbi:MAG: TonB C-terminal domain-containing protein [Polyangiaceae bacterium]